MRYRRFKAFHWELREIKEAISNRELEVLKMEFFQSLLATFFALPFYQDFNPRKKPIF